jgi:hypothetical protein
MRVMRSTAVSISTCTAAERAESRSSIIDSDAAHAWPFAAGGSAESGLLSAFGLVQHCRIWFNGFCKLVRKRRDGGGEL